MALPSRKLNISRLTTFTSPFPEVRALKRSFKDERLQNSGNGPVLIIGHRSSLLCHGLLFSPHPPKDTRDEALEMATWLALYGA